MLKTTEVVFLNKKNMIIITLLLLIVLNIVLVSAEPKCAVYFSGIGCPHCAKTDPFIVNDFVKNTDVVIIKYEVYKHPDNSALLYKYNANKGVKLGIPQIIAKKTLEGDRPILKKLKLSSLDEYCVLPDKNIPLQELNLNNLDGSPIILYKNYVLIKINNSNKTIHLDDLLNITLENKSINVEFSGFTKKYSKSIKYNNWIIGQDTGNNINNANTVKQDITKSKVHLTVFRTITLALVDAINPCALAVLTLILLSIFSFNPKKRKRVLYAGLLFSLAVFIMYFFYGILLIKFFKLISAFAGIKLIIYKVLGVLAILLGLIQLKDYIKYKPGTLTSEMPLSLRPKVKKLISKITSPKSAFFIGIFVTLFLLPCTIGPYVIMNGALSYFEFIKATPYLFLYNIIFVLPMLLITISVYYGMKIANVKNWKDKNIRKLHLVEGLLILIVGLTILFGLI